jgi:hypothetical protein
MRRPFKTSARKYQRACGVHLINPLGKLSARSMTSSSAGCNRWRDYRMRILQLFAALVSVLFPLLVTACTAETEPFQSQAHFRVAIRDGSTSPHFILLTVVDDRTGKATTGCTLAPFLVGAIERERDGWNDWRGEEAKRIALTNESHVFHFTKQSALDNLPLDQDARCRQACIAIKSGQSARMGDRVGNLILGPFVEEPNVVWSSCAPAAFPLMKTPPSEDWLTSPSWSDQMEA